MMGFVGGERSNNVGDSLDFEVSQQVALHLPLLSHPPSGSLSLPLSLSVCLFQSCSQHIFLPFPISLSLKLCSSCLSSLHDLCNKVHTVAVAFQSQRYTSQNSLFVFMHCSLNWIQS